MVVYECAGPGVNSFRQLVTTQQIAEDCFNASYIPRVALRFENLGGGLTRVWKGDEIIGSIQALQVWDRVGHL